MNGAILRERCERRPCSTDSAHVITWPLKFHLIATGIGSCGEQETDRSVRYGGAASAESGMALVKQRPRICLLTNSS